MKNLKKLALLLLFILFLGLLYSCNEDTTTTTNAMPVILGATDTEIYLFETFDFLDGVSAYDAEDGNLTSSITVNSETFDNTVVGNQAIVYSVVDSAGNQTMTTRTVIVLAIDESLYPLANYPNGIDLSLLPDSQKTILFTALEEYLTENLYGGIPLYHRGTGILYSSRTNLYFDKYNTVFGFGEIYSTLLEDDSNVLMMGDTFGNENEYTWRFPYMGYIETLNIWESDSSFSTDVTQLYSGTLYQFQPDDLGDRFSFTPNLAKSDPIAIGGSFIDGVMKSTTWEIQVKDDLTWTFNPRTDTSALSEGYEILDASDFYNTWKLALDNEWFHARSGGGDFVSMGIVGVAEYLNGTEQWNNVGIKLNEAENSIQLEFDNLQSAESIQYMFAFNGLNSPINIELYNALTTNYATSPETVASSGPYYLDEYVDGTYILLKKNENYPLSDLYHYTGLLYKYFSSEEEAIAEFVRGGLDYAEVPFSSLNDFASDDRLKIVDAGTVFSISINGFGTEEARDAYIASHPDLDINSDFVPEPILQYIEMKKALYYGIDRLTASSAYGVGYLPSSTYFTRQYYLPYDEGYISIYGTEEGSAFLSEYQGDEFMYDPVLALNYFKLAVAKGIEDGYYVAGSADQYTEITVDLVYATSTSQNYIDYINNIVSQYEELLVDDVNYVQFKINVVPVDFPDNYFEYILEGNTDLGIFGISYMVTSMYDYLKDYSDGYFDNNFTINFGIDTTSPVISVSYKNIDGKLVYEKWGYNTLIEALLGNTLVDGGVVKTHWDDATELFITQINLESDQIKSYSENTELVNELYGDNVMEITQNQLWDSMTAFYVTLIDDSVWAVVVGVENNRYVPYFVTEVYDDVETAMIQYLETNFGLNPDLISVTGPLTDEDILNNAYLNENYDYNSVMDIADDYLYNDANVSVYACQWQLVSTWDDVIVVIQLGDYYIAVQWL